MGKPLNIKESLAWAVAECRALGLRRTKAMEEVLRCLIENPRPLTMNDVVERLDDLCDRATIYRLLVRLEEKGILRRLGFRDRSAYYVMRYPDRHDDYLICTRCGSIEAIDLSCPVETMEREISKTSGFRDLYHELEFFGICPGCARD